VVLCISTAKSFRQNKQCVLCGSPTMPPDLPAAARPDILWVGTKPFFKEDADDLLCGSEPARTAKHWQRPTTRSQPIRSQLAMMNTRN
jgi:hypothetical protein